MTCDRVHRFKLWGACTGAFVLVGVLALAACGQKGPLFLPDDEQPVAQPPASDPGTTPASEERKEDKEKPR